MKFRNGFISNSSSTSFIITNTSDDGKTLIDFVLENPQIVEEFCSSYFYDYNQEQLVDSAVSLVEGCENKDYVFRPHESKACVFGDESGTVIGTVFDYALRTGGTSKSFHWCFDTYYR